MDNSCFPWNKLISDTDTTGGHTFEEIAFGYVESNYKQFNWKKTPMTRDGNKDAFAIISLFSTQQKEAEIWMEAKFSVTRKNMSRYTIDKTIVSALSYGNVSELFFVTNMLVSHHVKEQVLSALDNDGLGYNDVHFCTKYDLEIWLTNSEQGKQFFYKYFKGCRINNYIVHGLKVLGCPSFYCVNQNNSLFPEPLSVLRSGVLYIADIRVYSNIESEVSVDTEANSGLDIDDYKQIHLHEGINELTLKFIINNNNPIFKIILTSDKKDTEVIELSIPIFTTKTNKIIIESQNAICKKILDDFDKYEKTCRGCIIEEIVSPSGMGKSYLLEQITGSGRFRHKNIIFYSFSPAFLTNNHILAELYLRLYYYSISFDGNYNTLDNLNIPKEKNHVFLLLSQTDYRGFEQMMRNISSAQIIPMGYNKDRIIILDNTERLYDSQRVFLNTLINGIQTSKSHSFIIMSGRQHMFSQHPYRIILKPSDISNNLSQEFAHAKMAITSIIANNVYDVSSLSLFLEECQGSNIDNIVRNLITNKNSILENLILNKIDTVLGCINKDAKNMMVLIFTLSDGLRYELVDDDNMIQPLLQENLVKYGTDGYLPINNLIKTFFRKHYTSYDISSDIIKRYFIHLTEDERLRFYIGSRSYMQYLSKALQRTNVLMQRQDYITVAYILEPLFSPTIKLDILHEDSTCIRLRFNYIYAVANVDTNCAIRKEFENFANDIKYAKNKDAIICRIEALSEVVCFAFEDADIATARSVIREVKKASKNIFSDDNRINDALFLCDSTELLALCSEDRYDEATELLKTMEVIYGDTYGMHITKTRYARYLVHSDVDKALSIMQDVLPLLESERNYKWSNACVLGIQFMKYLKGTTDSIFTGVDTLMNSLPKFVSLYRSNLRLYAACALVNANGNFDDDNLASFYEYWYAYKNESGYRSNKEIGCDYIMEAAEAYISNNYNKMRSRLNVARTHFRHLGKTCETIIRHNTDISNHDELKIKKILFYNTHDSMNSDWFYFDPRMS